MTVRAARHVDVPAMVALLVEKQAQSIYAGRVDVDEQYTRKLFGQLVQRNGGVHTGATCVCVYESDDGKIVAFAAGALDRVYMIGKGLVAQDLFLVAGDDAPADAAKKLLKTYVDWAEANPFVVEINLSYTDVLPTGERMGPMYERSGFVQCGKMYRKTKGIQQEARP